MLSPQGAVSVFRRPLLKNEKWRTRLTTIYNGFPYDSAFEAQYAMSLDWRVKAKEIKSWDRPYSIPIYVNGEHILTTRVDFRIHENDGSFTLAETKGFETRDYKITKKSIEAVWLK